MSSGKFLAAGLGAVLVAAFVWSQRAHPPEAAAASGAPAVAVGAGRVVRGAVPVRAEVLGTLVADRRVTIAARLNAQVLEVAPRAGDRVAQGELLVRLETADLEANAARAEAGLQAADEALADAERELVRARELFEREARTRAELDRAVTARATAAAQRDAAAQALAAARTALAYGTLVAPFDGVVGERFVDPGDLAVVGAPLLSFYDPETLVLEVFPGERLLSGLAVGARVPCRVDAAGATWLEGVVREIAPEVDPVTRSGRIQLALPAGTSSGPGRVGRAALEVERREAWLAPAEAIVRRGHLELLFELEESGGAPHARLRVVRTGTRLEDGRVELVAGVDGELRVATRGADALRDGDRVKLEER